MLLHFGQKRIAAGNVTSYRNSACQSSSRSLQPASHVGGVREKSRDLSHREQRSRAKHGAQELRTCHNQTLPYPMLTTASGSYPSSRSSLSWHSDNDFAPTFAASRLLGWPVLCGRETITGQVRAATPLKALHKEQSPDKPKCFSRAWDKTEHGHDACMVSHIRHVTMSARRATDED